MKNLTAYLLSVSVCFCLLLLFTVPAIYGQDHHQQHGNVDFSVSCSEQAQEEFSRGLPLLHHMMYEQAEARFASAAEADGNCAMAYWGIAMTAIHPLWGERPTDEALVKGTKALEKAEKINPADERESAYIDAVTPFFKNWENTSYPDQLAAFESGYEQLHKTYPDDIDAAAFFALGHLATAPKEDKTFSHQEKAGALLEKLHKRAPEHPGLFHYIIHAYDNPMLAHRAVKVARGYDKIAPEVPHALHMPSHIFVRLGMWQDVIDWNMRSASAALAQPVGDMTSMHYAHALDYLMYAHLQRGEDRLAEKVREKMNNVQNLQPSLGTAYAIAAVQARYPLERGQWKEAATLRVDTHPGLPWERFTPAESILHYGRGLGSARTGDRDGVRRALEKLSEIHKRLNAAGEQYWAVLTDAQIMTVKAWQAFSEGNPDRALNLMIEAADKEDSVDKHPVTPGHVLPARELLGDMLMELNRPAEAYASYLSSLDMSANRFNSLYGAGRAAELSGDLENARKYYSALMEISAGADIERAAYKTAEKFLASN